MRGIKHICLTPLAGLSDRWLPMYSNITSIMLPKLAGRNGKLSTQEKYLQEARAAVKKAGQPISERKLENLNSNFGCVANKPNILVLRMGEIQLPK